MTHYRLHCLGASGNSCKVALFLNCAGLDWEPVGVDFAGGETRDGGWRAATNPRGEVPVLEADGRRMSQSGAILSWLAKIHGAFAPDGPEERFETMRWLLFDNHKFTGSFASHRILLSMTPEPTRPSLLAYLRARVESAFPIVDRHLADRCFILGDRPTIVDFSWSATSTSRLRRPGSILPLPIPPWPPGGGAWRRCRAGSHPTR